MDEASKTDESPQAASNALDKLIRLARKNCNFDYIDPLTKYYLHSALPYSRLDQRSCKLRVSYPVPAPDGLPPQPLLRTFWRQITYHYFKPIDTNEFDRLVHFRQMIDTWWGDNVRFDTDPAFWNLITRTFAPEYVNRCLRSEEDSIDYRNWTARLYLLWLSFSASAKQQKKCSQQLAAINQEMKHTSTMLTNMLKLQERRLNKLLPEPTFNDSTVGRQIEDLEAELEQISNDNRESCHILVEKVTKQLQSKEVVSCVTSPQDYAYCQKLLNHYIANPGQHRLQIINEVETILKFLEYTIFKLQKRQVAESISKITRSERVKNELRFIVTFQKGMGLKAVSMTVPELIELNELRQYSLLKFYNTSLKSPYSFICQNYFGFKQIYENRSSPCRLRSSNILQSMRRAPIESTNTPSGKQFNKFQICHHCKLLYPLVFLVPCEYEATRHGIPVPKLVYYDPYIQQMIKSISNKHIDEPRATLRLGQRRRNSYFHYSKKGNNNINTDDSYHCDRLFCKHCIKSNYQSNIQQDRNKIGLCPFCSDCCFCTRCARNDTIIRLKSMYLLLGGDMGQLCRNNPLQKMALQNEEAMGLRKKSRTDKPNRRISDAPFKINQKMTNIRYQLEDLRIICDLVKRRQKQKQKLLQAQKQIFRGKIEQICPRFDYQAIDETVLNEKDDNEEEMQKKWSKKLKRMIL